MGKALDVLSPLKMAFNLFKKPEKDKPKPPPVLPDPEDPAAKLAAQKRLRDRAAGGRAGTIFTGAYGGGNLSGTA